MCTRTLSLPKRRSITKIHLALPVLVRCKSPCFVSEAPCRLLWNNVPSPDGEVALLLSALIELLRCFIETRTVRFKSQNRLDFFVGSTFLFPQITDSPHGKCILGASFPKLRSSSANEFIGLLVGT